MARSSCRLESNRVSARRTRAKQGQLFQEQERTIARLRQQLMEQQGGLEASVADVSRLQGALCQVHKHVSDLQQQVRPPVCFLQVLVCWAQCIRGAALCADAAFTKLMSVSVFFEALTRASKAGTSCRSIKRVSACKCVSSQLRPAQLWFPHANRCHENVLLCSFSSVMSSWTSCGPCAAKSDARLSLQRGEQLKSGLCVLSSSNCVEEGACCGLPCLLKTEQTSVECSC